MLSYLSQAFQDSSLCVPTGHTLDGQLEQDISVFGSLFMPHSEIEYSDFLDGLIPEFNLDGFFEDSLSDHSPPESASPGSRKLSGQLASTQANESSAANLEDSETNCSENLNKESGFRLEAFSAVSTASSLRKRSPVYEEEYSTSVEPKKPSQFLNDFDRQAFARDQAVNLVISLIDRKKLSGSMVAGLDPESISLISNFSFMIYAQKLSADSLQENLDSLNVSISTNLEKKKRNEERIKYVFKRVNKIILKKFMEVNELPNEDEIDAMHKILKKYFGPRVEQEPKTQLSRYFTLLFKPSNMYRNDLKDVFSHPSYLQDFKKALENEFVSEFKKKRQFKIQAYMKDLINEMSYSMDKSDPSILQKKVSRLPWSLDEVEKGIQLFQDIFRMH